MGTLITIDTTGIGALGVRLIDAIENALKGETMAFRAATMARARADAMLVEGEARIESEYRQAAALRRVEAESVRHQKNMERIVELAIPHVAEGAKPEDVDPDWINNFFERVKNVSNEDFRALWARVLAGEMNAPGAFHKRTLNIISNLEDTEAKLFEKLCSLTFEWESGLISPLVFDARNEFYADLGLDYSGLMTLESAGLVNLEVTSGYRAVPSEWPILISYCGQNIRLNEARSLRTLDGAEPSRVVLGVVVMSTAGRQLYRLVDTQPVPGFLDFVLKEYKGHSPELVDEKAGTGSSEA